MDIAASIQAVTEEILLKLAASLQRETGETNLCLAGGVALNCVGNGRLLRESPFEDIWIQPAAGDAGGALGCAQVAWYADAANARHIDSTDPGDSMRGSYLGPKFSNEEIEAELNDLGAVVQHLDDAALIDEVARLLEAGNVVGWFQGRMEFGPRALGGRSILGDPRDPKMQETMNLKIKYRESFRPFAPSVLAERVSDYFELDSPSPYMLIVAPLDPQQRLQMSAEQEQLFGIEKLNVARSNLPAVTHVDYSARVQTVHAETNPRYHALLQAFNARTGCGVLINTSFNVRGEPIVGTPSDAYRCFMRTQMDYLVVENCLLAKSDQPPWQDDSDWQNEFELD
jgi:carbamoyltransferase